MIIIYVRLSLKVHRSAQLSRIREKRTRVEEQILEEHFDSGKSAVELRKWQEALEGPKPKITGMGSKISVGISGKGRV